MARLLRDAKAGIIGGSTQRVLQMCGIFGWVLSSKKRQSSETLRRLTNLMIHRGPMARVIASMNSPRALSDRAWTSPAFDHRHRWRRTTDVERGRTIALNFNGEIYNYVELRQELRAAGHPFRPAPTPRLLSKHTARGD